MRHLACLIAVLFVTAGCEVIGPTNPYDPATALESQAPARLHGVVRTSSAEPLEAVTVSLFAGVHFERSVVTAADGTFDFDELVPGGYSLDFAHPTHQGSARAVVLIAGDDVTLDLSLVPLQAGAAGTGRITGTVQRGGELARPIAVQDHSGITVEVRGLNVRTTTNAAGRFDLDLLPGTFDLDLSAPGHSADVRVGVVVNADATSEVEPAVLVATPGSLAGVVALEGGTTPVEATVTVEGTGLSTVTDAAGSFLLGAVAAGARTITIARDGYSSVDVGVVVVAGDTVSLPRTTLALARGAVVGSVDLVGRSDDSGVAVSLSGTTFAAVTTEAGAFRIADVPVGVYELSATKDGFLRGVSSTVVVTAAQDTVVAPLTLGQRTGDFEINGGALFTRSTGVTLRFNNPDATQYEASEDPSFLDPLFDTEFVDLVGDVAFELSAGDGDKVVFVKFRDSDGVESGPFSSTITLDSTPPAPPAGQLALAINGGAAFTNNASGIVTLTLVATDATSGVTSMRVANDAILDDDASVAFQTTTVVSLAAGADGVRTVFVRFEDAAGNASEVFSDSIVLDRERPVVSSFSINGGAGFSTNSVVGLDVVATDTLAGVSRMALSTNGSFAADVSEPFAASRTFFLTPGEGSRSAFIKVFDAAGNESDVTSDAIVVDVAPPVGGSVVINANAAQTNTAAVTLALAATGASNMRVSLDGVLDTEPVEPFVATRAATLPAGDGAKTVFVVFVDDAGNTSSVVSDSIVLDTTAPTTPAGLAAITIDSRAAFSNDAGGIVTLGLVQEDATTSVATMQLSVDGVLDNEAFVPFQGALVFTVGSPTVDGTKTVLVRFRDAAGNTSGSSSASIVFDRTAPAISSLTINAGAGTTVSSVVDVAIAATDAGSGVVEVALSTSAGFAVESFEAFGSPRSVVLAAGDGTRSVFAKVKDAAGNVSSVVSDAIVVDTAPPTSGNVVINSGAAVTNNATVSLALSAQGAATMTLSTDGVFDTETAVPFAATSTVTFVGAGPKTVFVLFTDSAGNSAAVVTDSIEIDVTAPTSPTLALNTATPGFTSSTGIAASIGGVGATRMKVRVVEDANCAVDPAVVAADFTSVTAEAFQTTRTVVLPPNAAATNTGAAPANRCKHVQLQLLDDAGNASGIVQARIELDQLAPDAPRIATVSTVIDDDNDGARDFDVVLAVDAADHNFAAYQVRNGGADFADVAAIDLADATCVSTAPTCTIRVALNQSANTRTENRIEVLAVDRAGTRSVADVLIVTEDSEPPAAPTNLVATAADQEVALSWTASSSSDVAGYRVGYALKNNATCPTTVSAYVGASLATQGQSPIDVGLNTALRLTGFSNNLELCFAVLAYDKTVLTVPSTPGPQLSTLAVTSTAPSEVGMQRIGRLTGAQLGIGSGLPRAVALRDGMLYVAVSGAAGGVLELDVSDEACFALTNATAFASCTNLKKSATTLTDPRDLQLHGNFAFIADGSSGTRVYRVEEGRAPVLVVTIPLNGATPAKIAMSVAVAQNFLAVGRTSSAVRTFDGVVDIYALDSLYSASPTAPALFGSLAQAASGTFAGRTIFGFTDVDFEAGTLAAGSQLAFVSVFGVNPFGAPTQRAEGGGAVKLAGRFIYGANDDNGPDNDMHVIDLGAAVVDIDPSGTVDNRVPVVSRAAGTASHRIALLGPYVLVAGRHVLDIYDASDRQRLRFVATYNANFTADGGAAEFDKEVNRGSLAAEGNRVFFTSATVAEIDVLRFGDASRLEAVSSIEEPGGGTDAVLYADTFVQGRSDAGVLGQAPQAIVHLGREQTSIDGQNANAAVTATVSTEDDIIVMSNSSFGASSTIERVVRASNGALSAFVSTPMPAGTHAFGTAVRWPWVIAATTSEAGGSFFDPKSIELRVFDARPSFGAMTQVNSTTIATTAGAGWNAGPGAVAVHGGFVYLAVADNHFGGSSGQAGQGLYRATFNAHTGAVGTFTRVETGAITGVYPYGRRVFFARNLGGFVNGGVGLGDLRGQTLADPSTWTSANVVTVSTTYAYEHRVVFSGPVFFMANDLDGAAVRRITYNPTTFQPQASTTVLTFDPGADCHGVQIAGDRVYYHLLATGGLVFRTR